MSMRIILLIISLNCILLINAQNIKTLENNEKRFFVLDSLNIKESNFVEIEIRINYMEFLHNEKNSTLTIIRKNKDKLWTGEQYKYYYYNKENYDFKNIDKQTIIFDDSWEKVWNSILKNNFLNIKTEAEIEKRQQPLIVIADGNYYRIEIVKKKGTKVIEYYSPEVKLNECISSNMYCPDISKFNALLNLLRSQINF
ncbi:hypothetical protein M2451_003808 [Dysgonomonas sp. PFB1-18]|uniref:hypothetical protein n=1 Tax=unclassified Dysgonomonas TaxID=2630389 RepID=UPI0024737687|nr:MULTISPECIES: hypothetical protein [unclassified Dysgonomonas]MDH6310944.1 hypothetical protein [Dysgonomonas sp. PF1-14]MDH6340841.1 hypothetical protein [Dysgonomonas sp. PF1-16]MDH6382467.1 hypothetical protein [Dysgonomonas sp. PFB1-18]MDH6399816.1 hypothetical protein [Dysgonomonas sp. PF1-23]